MRRLRRFFSSDESPKAVVFDVGTRAARALVGPRRPPDIWKAQTFFNDGALFQLGNDVERFDGALPPDESPALEKVVRFMEIYRDLFLREGGSMEDAHGVGTAVFRWLSNREEVVKHIRERTGIAFKVLDQDTEATLSLAAIIRTAGFDASGPITERVKDEEAILLVDQGGGSVEISYTFPGNLSRGDRHSIDQLGTTSLREKLFTLTPQGHIPPHLNTRPLDQQYEDFLRFIQESIEGWEGYPELSKTRIRPYGMGSAASSCLGKGNNFTHHNQVLTAEFLREFLAKARKGFGASNLPVKSFYELASRKEHSDRMDSQLVQLCGLPVYLFLLDKFSLDRMRYAGYGLRYGVYVWKYGFGLDF